MRTKRSTGSKKTTARAARTSAKASMARDRKTATKTWVAGIDGLSLGIAAAVIVAAGVLVAAYRPTHPGEVAQIEAVQPASSASPAADVRPAAAMEAKPAEETATATSGTWPAPLTITGCLDREGDSYRLTDAAGVGVPKARSWKTGFLKKSPSAVTLANTTRHAWLQDHLGQRISVTGTMVNREVQVGSMRTLSETCSEKTKI